MKKFFNKQIIFIIGALIIGFFLNQTNCIQDPYCETDPLYGGCSSVCKSGTSIEWAIKSLGLWILLNLGSFFGKYQLKENKESLKDFLDNENLKYTVRMIDDEWKIDEQKNKKENQKENERIVKLIKNIKNKTQT